MAISTIASNLGIEVCKTVGFAATGAGYVPIGNPTEYVGRMLLLQNKTDGDMWFSDNGIDNKFPLFAGDKVVLDCMANQFDGRGLWWPVGSKLYVKRITVPTLGSIYLTVFYGE